MSSKTATNNDAQPAGPGHSLYGDALLQQLQHGWASLPTKTVLALVLSGVRVRLMRSVVTMISIVLAIAFLTYTGITNELYYSAAAAVEQADERAAEQPAVITPKASPTDAQGQADTDPIEDLRYLLRRSGVNIQMTLAGNPMDRWLIIMALLTCTVGIANAMLMSVTERFREIGTMKCLGALDSLVIKIFLIESSVLGVVGALMGIVVGAVVALLAAVLQLGSLGLHYFPYSQSIVVAAWAVLAGMVLPVVGAVYPAIVAARMKPVDALRVDE